MSILIVYKLYINKYTSIYIFNYCFGITIYTYIHT